MVLFCVLAGLGLCCSTRALHCSAPASLAMAHALSCPAACGILVLQSEVELESSSLQGRFLTAGPRSLNVLIPFAWNAPSSLLINGNFLLLKPSSSIGSLWMLPSLRGGWGFVRGPSSVLPQPPHPSQVVKALALPVFPSVSRCLLYPLPMSVVELGGTE